MLKAKIRRDFKNAQNPSGLIPKHHSKMQHIYKKLKAQTFVFNLLVLFDVLSFLVTSAASSDSLILNKIIKIITNS